MIVDWFVEAEQRTALEPGVTEALRYVPPWVRSVNVRFDPDESQLASVSVLPEYRTLTIRVGSGWFSETASERRVALIHEVTHAYVEVLAVVFSDLLNATTNDDDALRDWAREQWRRAEEGVCSDLSRAIAAAHPEV
jgi:hypothetical protein